MARTLGVQVAPGQVDFLTILHELGHSLGLSHPGNYDAPIDDPATARDERLNEFDDPTTAVDERELLVEATYNKDGELKDAAYEEDTRQYTIMSYFGEWETGANYLGLSAATPLLHDIAAVQRLYGANMETRLGATTYGFNSNADRASFRIDSDSEKAVFAIWDAGGVNTLDFSGYSGQFTNSGVPPFTYIQTINLAAGSFSSVGGLVKNVAVAEGVVMHNAIGGNGQDQITGNAEVNRLFGNGGADTLDGGGGADRLYGGADSDLYIADAGDNIIEIADAGLDMVQTGLTSYTLTPNVENLTFTYTVLRGFVPPVHTGSGNSLANTMRGGNGRETLNGRAGNDDLYGNGAADTLFGGSGNDHFFGGSGADRLIGGDDDDTYFVEAGDLVVERLGTDTGIRFAGGTDTVQTALSTYTLTPFVENLIYVGSHLADFAGAGNDLNNTIFAGGGSDMLDGGAGADTMDGGAGADTMDGGDGFDTASYAGSAVAVTVDLASGVGLFDDAAGDRLAAIEKVVGSAHGDDLRGSARDEALDGGGGDDVLTAGLGADILDGGEGNDTFWIDNADTVSGGDGRDTVKASTDTIATGFNFALAGTGIEGVQGNSGDDWIDGSGVNLNVVFFASGGAGQDTILGSAGIDALRGEEGNDVLSGGARDFLWGGDGDDHLTGAGDGRAMGGNGDDVIFGAAFDILRGEAGNDTITGGDGYQEIWGGADSDSMTGRAGRDDFSFGDLWGADVIGDFQVGVDKVRLSEVTGLDSFGQLNIADVAEGAQIAFAGNTIVLMGLTANQVVATDFVL